MLRTQAVDDAKKRLDEFIADLTQKLDKTKSDAMHQIDQAEKALNNEKAKVDRDVDGNWRGVGF